MTDDAPVMALRINDLRDDVDDHEERLRKVENAQARSAWLGAVITPLVTAVAVIVVQQLFIGGA